MRRASVRRALGQSHISRLQQASDASAGRQPPDPCGAVGGPPLQVLAGAQGLQGVGGRARRQVRADADGACAAPLLADVGAAAREGLALLGAAHLGRRGTCGGAGTNADADARATCANQDGLRLLFDAVTQGLQREGWRGAQGGENRELGSMILGMRVCGCRQNRLCMETVTMVMELVGAFCRGA